LRKGFAFPNMIHVKKLTVTDLPLARRTFALMAAVFEEAAASVSDSYLTQLLARPDFWALAAFVDDDLAGGLTAHVLPLTRTEASEIFVYDIAVHSDYQRRGVGRQLMDTLRDHARSAGIRTLFVPAENEDTHALEFYRALGGEPTAVTVFTFEEDEERIHWAKLSR
jgi:aminoglycoside 3-N-acetyltransferase I